MLLTNSIPDSVPRYVPTDMHPLLICLYLGLLLVGVGGLLATYSLRFGLRDKFKIAFMRLYHRITTRRLHRLCYRLIVAFSFSLTFGTIVGISHELGGGVYRDHPPLIMAAFFLYFLTGFILSFSIVKSNRDYYQKMLEADRKQQQRLEQEKNGTMTDITPVFTDEAKHKLYE